MRKTQKTAIPRSYVSNYSGGEEEGRGGCDGAIKASTDGLLRSYRIRFTQATKLQEFSGYTSMQGYPIDLLAVPPGIFAGWKRNC